MKEDDFIQSCALFFVFIPNCAAVNKNIMFCSDGKATELAYSAIDECQWSKCPLKAHEINRLKLTCLIQENLDHQRYLLEKLQDMEVGAALPLYGGGAQLRPGRLQLPAQLRQLTERLAQLQLRPQPLTARLVRRVSELLHQLRPSGAPAAGWRQAAQSLSRKGPFEPWPGFGDTLVAMATGRITSADVATVGSQLKLLLTLEGDQQILFKPQWYRRDRPLRGGLLSGRDRPHAELASWHLQRLLAVGRAPPVTGRALRLDAEVRPVATARLRRTITRRGPRCCVSGECRYCSPERPVCTDSAGLLAGAAVLWLPAGGSLRSHPHPWQRTYTGQPARWEQEAQFCRHVRSLLKPHRLLDLVDAAVLDFLIQNGDRHHYETLGRGGPMVLIDNGKSFGDADVDHLDILAPLLQCCSLRRRTWRALRAVPAGQLGPLMSVVAADRLGPLLTAPHLSALSRRHQVVLEVVRWCEQHSRPGHHVLVGD
ncbi:glycosaminoglycan xylosylkinase-like isoform X1 [Amphibalanus amphitrite]|uniref:glycosaminoglycan xylosylkinase-like isoform X1 n=2 Tax=Amphibalanus amphitrite TaxID=1232801 RepID=UPI001C90A90D|nr:glycosaminoglycan xylosylkinase-like isoform X1 [Amphibalanus amphitrite]